jgi:hypothetical protein
MLVLGVASYAETIDMRVSATVTTPTHRIYEWQLSGRTCDRDGERPLDLHVQVALSEAADPTLLGVSLTTSGQGQTCGAKWSPTWAERAIDNLGWVGHPLSRILQGPTPADPFACACTEVSFGPKLWRLLASVPQRPL